MIGALITLAMVVIGGSLLVSAARTAAVALRSGRRALSPDGTIGGAGHLTDAGELSDIVEIAGTVAEQTTTSSPLQGLPCVWWRVRALTLRPQGTTSAGAGVESLVHVDVTASQRFTLTTVGGPMTVDPAHSTGGGPARTIERDQGSLERTIDIAGQTHRLPPTAWGSRLIEETTLSPGTPVWVRGRLTHPSGAPLLSGDPARPLRISLTAPAVRLRRGVAVAGVQAGAALLLLSAVAVRIS
ncbi:hypothetical protein BH23ACT9_BH23ACT9_10600 [soil metagenome]